MNGSLTVEETTYPSQVEISCDEGFILRGSHRRKCQANKKWNGTDTFCDGNKHSYIIDLSVTSTSVILGILQCKCIEHDIENGNPTSVTETRDTAMLYGDIMTDGEIKLTGLK